MCLLNSITPPLHRQNPSTMEQEQEGATRDRPLFTRHPGNPILSREDWPYPINSVFNAGAVTTA